MSEVGARRATPDRAAAAWLARGRFGYPAKAVAQALGYAGASSIAQAVHRIEENMKRVGLTLAKQERQLAND